MTDRPCSRFYGCPVRALRFRSRLAVKARSTMSNLRDALRSQAMLLVGNRYTDSPIHRTDSLP
jgi:hypothetical protein